METRDAATTNPAVDGDSFGHQTAADVHDASTPGPSGPERAKEALLPGYRMLRAGLEIDRLRAELRETRRIMDLLDAEWIRVLNWLTLTCPQDANDHELRGRANRLYELVAVATRPGPDVPPEVPVWLEELRQQIAFTLTTMRPDKYELDNFPWANEREQEPK